VIKVWSKNNNDDFNKKSQELWAERMKDRDGV
jgi:hypothetical protein